MARTTSIMQTLQTALDVAENTNLVTEKDVQLARQWLDDVVAFANDFDEVLKPANESG